MESLLILVLIVAHFSLVFRFATFKKKSLLLCNETKEDLQRIKLALEKSERELFEIKTFLNINHFSERLNYEKTL
jgi:hypothetical protein